MSQSSDEVMAASPETWPARRKRGATVHDFKGGRTGDASSRRSAIWNYAAIARPDHWFKNVFMAVGVLFAFFYYPELLAFWNPWLTVWALAATCLLASSNYVINEILDAPSDRHHPVKHARPIPSGRVNVRLAYVEWIVLLMIGGAMAYAVNIPFFVTGVTLLAMGIIYNVRPIRSKDLPYVDVLSESVNNVLRLALGWFVVNATAIPPLSLMAAYWMVGAFFMATKRFSEYRAIGDAERAAAYRASFRHYSEDRLLISMFCYATATALFLGVFIVRYHLELILSVPLIAGFFGEYMRVALKQDSSAQAPERLYRERRLMVYLLVCLTVFIVLMFVRIPALYDWFNVRPSSVPSLWEI